MLKEKTERETKFKLQWHREAGRGGGGKARRVGGGSAEREGSWFVMDRRAGECGKFQSRVNGMAGKGGWRRSACVLTLEENGLVSLQVGSSRCGSYQTSSDSCFCSPPPIPQAAPLTVCCYTKNYFLCCIWMCLCCVSSSLHLYTYGPVISSVSACEL